MDKKILIATRNVKKRKEMEELLQDTGWQVLTLQVYPDAPDVIEDGATFLENAAKKAISASLYTGVLTLADDSGLEVDALNGRPGVHSALLSRGFINR